MTRPAARPLSWESGSLSNGVDLYTVTDRTLPYVTVSIIVRGGSRVDGSLPGVTDFTAGLLSYGAGERDAVQFARDVEFLGADLSADAGADTVAIDLETLSRSLDEGLSLMSSMVVDPLFRDDDIERERAQRIANLKSSGSDPDWLAETALRERVMLGTPYATPLEGTMESIGAIDRPAILDVHQRLLTSPSFLVATGDIDLEELSRLLESKLGDSKRGVTETLPPRVDGLGSQNEEITLIERPGSAHTALRLARPAVNRKHPDYLPLRVLTTILGDYFNSRLNSRLREDLGYTYGAWAALEAKEFGGILSIGTSVRGERVGETLRTIREELERVVQDGVTTEELEIVTRYMAGRHALAQETPEQIGRMVGTIALYDLGKEYYTEMIEEIISLTTERLRSTAEKYLDPSLFTTIAAGPAPGI